jgi:hypothetical protein
VYRNSCGDEAEHATFTYIDGWHNHERIREDLGWLSPAEYEATWHTKNIDTPKPTNTTGRGFSLLTNPPRYRGEPHLAGDAGLDPARA